MVGWHSPTQWTWVWVNSGSWWWKRRPGVLQSMGSQRVGHAWGTKHSTHTHTHAYNVCIVHYAQLLSRVWPFATTWTAVHQAPRFMGIVQARVLEWVFALFQGIFPTQGLNPGLPHCRWILYKLSHQGSPTILEWVAVLLSRVSSQPRDQTQVSCIVDRFFSSWSTMEAQEYWSG